MSQVQENEESNANKGIDNDDDTTNDLWDKKYDREIQRDLSIIDMPYTQGQQRTRSTSYKFTPTQKWTKTEKSVGYKRNQGLIAIHLHLKKSE